MTTPTRILIWVLLIGQVLTGLTVNLLLKQSRDQQAEIAALTEVVVKLVESDSRLMTASVQNSKSIEILADTLVSMADWITNLQAVVLGEP
jgi:hypothetical protein